MMKLWKTHRMYGRLAVDADFAAWNAMAAIYPGNPWPDSRGAFDHHLSLQAEYERRVAADEPLIDDDGEFDLLTFICLRETDAVVGFTLICVRGRLASLTRLLIVPWRRQRMMALEVIAALRTFGFDLGIDRAWGSMLLTNDNIAAACFGCSLELRGHVVFYPEPLESGYRWKRLCYEHERGKFGGQMVPVRPPTG